MIKNFLFAILLILVFVIILFADENLGKITGKVIDGSNGSTITDAVIRLEYLDKHSASEIYKGTLSDLDGLFELDNLKPGEYNLKIGFIGYKSKNIRLDLKAHDMLEFDIVLEMENSTTDTINIEATRLFNNESSILLKQKSSGNISDGISEQQIKRTPDAVASEVMKRISGISIVNDKFVFIRGTSERYSNATLNGTQLPSTEPDKKAFTFDLFPSNLLENIIVEKSFSPELQGNFSGGLVEMTTKDIPESFTLNFSTSGSFTSGTTSESNFLTYNAGQKNLLGINLGKDNGSRQLPSNFPNETMISTNFTNDQLISFGKELNNNWGQCKMKAPLNGGFQLSVGNRFNVLKNPLGIFGAYTYRNSFQNKSEVLNSFDETPNLYSTYSGDISTYKVIWGLLFNLCYKIGENHKISMKNSIIQNGEDATQTLQGYNPDLQKKLYSTQFKERNLQSFTLEGDHYLGKLSGMRIKWTASYSEAKRDEPDFKTMSYQRDPTSDNPFEAAITTGSLTFDGGSRLFSTLNDISRMAKTDFELPLKILNNFDIKFGTLANGTRRIFNARLFAPSFYNYTNIFTQQAIKRMSLDSIFNPDNIKDSVLYYSEYTRGSDSYQASDNLYSGYFMFDALYHKFRIIAGARMEYYEQRLNSFEDSYSQAIKVYLKNNDILPSINLIYRLNDNTNIRGSYYQTVSRPEFREIAPFGFTDFTTRDFVIGNTTDLHRTLIRNYDARYELFPEPGEILALSIFYKKIDAPIEEVYELTSGNPLKTFKNAPKGAENYGIEIEVRKNLKFISESLEGFSFNGNLSIINSKINLAGTTSLAGDKERRMQGQAPFALNLGLYYDNPVSGTSINLSFNKIGDRISEVGLGSLSNELEQGRDLLDFSFSQSVFKRIETKFMVNNLLNENQVFFSDINGKRVITKSYSTGISYGLTLTYKY